MEIGKIKNMKSAISVFFIAFFQLLCSSQQVETHLRYDAGSRLTNVWNSIGQRTIILYDTKGNLTKRVSFGPAKVTLPDNIGKVIVGKTKSICLEVSHEYLPITNILTKAISSSPMISDLKILGESTNRVLSFASKKKGRVELSVIATDGFVSSTNNISLIAVE